MKILIVTRSYDQLVGGMEVHVQLLAKEVASRGHVVHVATSGGQSTLPVEKKGIKIHYLRGSPGKYSPEFLQAVEAFINQGDYDIIHSQSIAVRFKPPAPLVVTCHGTTRSEIESAFNEGVTVKALKSIILNMGWHPIMKKAMRNHADAVIAISDDIERRLKEEFDVPEEKIHRIYHGIDTDLFHPADGARAGEGPPEVLAVSVLKKQKGVQNLLLALSSLREQLPEVQLRIVGDGPYRRSLEDLARRLKVPAMFMGQLTQDELSSIYRKCTVFVNPTLRVESFGLVSIEAMACGKPVIASDIGAVRSFIEPEKTGILYPPRDVDALCGALQRVLSDTALASDLGGAARCHVEESFSKASMAEKTIGVYESLQKG